MFASNVIPAAARRALYLFFVTLSRNIRKIDLKLNISFKKFEVSSFKINKINFTEPLIIMMNDGVSMII